MNTVKSNKFSEVIYKIYWNKGTMHICLNCIKIKTYEPSQYITETFTQ